MNIIFMLTGCKSVNNIMKNIEVEGSKCRLINEKDTHGGFLGDGEYFAKIVCSSINESNLSANWKKLPISDNLNEILNMKWCENSGCNNFYEKYNVSINLNGYYYFFDRHSESKNKYDDNELNNRSSWNFTLAILDSDTNTIYCYEIDT